MSHGASSALGTTIHQSLKEHSAAYWSLCHYIEDKFIQNRHSLTTTRQTNDDNHDERKKNGRATSTTGTDDEIKHLLNEWLPPPPPPPPLSSSSSSAATTDATDSNNCILQNLVYFAHKEHTCRQKITQAIGGYHVSSSSVPRGLAAQLQAILPTASSLSLDPLECVAQVRRHWDSRLRFELQALADKLRLPLLHDRKTTHAEMSTAESLRFVYTADDLLDALTNIVSTNVVTGGHVSWSMINISLATPSLAQLRQRYDDLKPHVRQVGVDDNHSDSVFGVHSAELGQRLRHSYIPLVRQYAKRGIPAALRPYFWRAILGCERNEFTAAYGRALDDDTRTVAMTTDCLLQFDVDHAANNDEVFVFREAMRELLLRFSRDRMIPHTAVMCNNCAPVKCISAVAPVLAPCPADLYTGASYDRVPACVADDTSSDGDNNAVAVDGGRVRRNQTPNNPYNQLYMAMHRASSSSSPSPSVVAKHVRQVPDNGVVPFYGQAIMMGQLCFLFDSIDDAYFIYARMYSWYFCKLHTISSLPDTILYLSKMFESLASGAKPNAFFHCIRLGCHPLRIVFPWMFTAFAGVLPVAQVLQLWDRVLAYDSLELVAVAAAAIFAFRASSVEKATSALEVEGIFKETAGLNVIPLLQNFLRH